MWGKGGHFGVKGLPTIWRVSIASLVEVGWFGVEHGVVYLIAMIVQGQLLDKVRQSTKGVLFLNT